MSERPANARGGTPDLALPQGLLYRSDVSV